MATWSHHFESQERVPLKVLLTEKVLGELFPDHLPEVELCFNMMDYQITASCDAGNVSRADLPDSKILISKLPTDCKYLEFRGT
jgi:hypothetical protein